MDDALRGFVAGIAATAVLSLVMVVKAQSGVAPDFDMIAILAQAVEAPGQPFFGWAAHVAIGVFLWGGLFALVADTIPGSTIGKGIGLGVFGWLITMLVFLPATGHAVLGVDMGTAVPALSLMFHVLFGVVLATAYRALGGAIYGIAKQT